MARWPRTATSSSSSSSARSSSPSWWWWWLLPLPVASAFKRLLLRLMALWLNSPLRRLRLGTRPAFLRLGGADENDDHDMYEENNQRYDSTRLTDRAAVVSSAAVSVDAVGLVNVGNTCFVNAILQCLAVLPAFHASIEQEIEALQVLQTNTAAVNADSSSSHEKQLVRLNAAKALLTVLRTLAPSLNAVEGNHTRDDRSDQDEEKEERYAYDSRQSSFKRRRGDGVKEQQANSFANKPTATRRLDRDAMTRQVRAFLDAMRSCTDLISERDQHQEQQDAEVR